MRKISDYILSRLADAGITHAAMVYGGAISELADAFTRQDRLKYVVMQHEQACSFFAEGYAQVKGVPGLAIGTSGPGGHNMVTGIANCYYNSVPAIFLVGQVQTRFIRPPGSGLRQLGFQETPIVDIVRPITKFACTLLPGDSISLTMDCLLHECTEGRPGPVLLELPSDLQGADYEF